MKQKKQYWYNPFCFWDKQTLYWIVFVVISLVLFAGYFSLEKHHGEELKPFLKGLELTEHFALHYLFGVLIGLLILLVYIWYRKVRLNEPLILTVTVLLSHFPDIRAWYRGIFIHEPWEVIFLLHTVIDEYPSLILLFVVLNVLLIFAYYKLAKLKKLPV